MWLEGPATVHAAVKDNGDGTYVATHKATVAGMYQLYITNGGSAWPAPLLLASSPLCVNRSIGQTTVISAA